MPRLSEDELKPVAGQLPLKWHGGKFYLADKIISMMPSNVVHYVEPFFGGGAVLFRKSCKGSEVINDLNCELTNFWRILASQEQFPMFVRAIEAIPFSEVEWEDACDGQRVGNELERAISFFVRYRQSRQGLGKGFATLSRNRTRKDMNEQVSSWLSAVEGLPECHARLKRVLILNRRALDVIKEQDGPNTLFYLDPPYLQDTRSAKWSFGDYEMSVADHEELLNLLTTIKGKFLLSGYPSGRYENWAYEYKWTCEEIKIPNNASGSKEKRIMTECVWRNF